MKYLFLDVDGVLNARPGSLDSDKLNLLRHIVSETRCSLVLSSTWRKVEHQKKRLIHALAQRGLLLFGETPVLEQEVRGLIHVRPRWEEIQTWLRELPVHHHEYVILDDEPDFGPLHAHHVKTESHIGLTDEIAREVINHLNQP